MNPNNELKLEWNWGDLSVPSMNNSPRSGGLCHPICGVGSLLWGSKGIRHIRHLIIHSPLLLDMASHHFRILNSGRPKKWDIQDTSHRYSSEIQHSCLRLAAFSVLCRRTSGCDICFLCCFRRSTVSYSRNGRQYRSQHG